MAETGETRWFVRARGTVTGPFTFAQLETLRKRGQLARFQEVSPSPQGPWERASAVPNLFPAPAPSQPAASGNTASGAIPLDGGYATVNEPAGAAGNVEWFFLRAGVQGGPVNVEHLRQLIAGRELDPSDSVWRDGMPVWMPIREVAELSVNLTNPAPAAAQPGGFVMNAGQAPGPAAVMPQTTNGLAIASLVLGIVWLCGLGSILATIFGAVALNQIARSQGTVSGKGMALTGLILGIIGLLPSLLYLLVVLGALSSLPFLAR